MALFVDKSAGETRFVHENGSFGGYVSRSDGLSMKMAVFVENIWCLCQRIWQKIVIFASYWN